MKKKILFIMTGLRVGGAEKFSISLVNSIDKERFASTVISLSNENALKEELNSDVQFIALPRRSKFDLRPLFDLRKLLKIEQPDKIFCVGLFPFFVVTCSGIFAKKKSKIISYHTTIPLNKKTDYLHRLYFGLVRNIDLIITVSKNQEIYTAKRYHVPTNLFKTIHNGVDINHWKPAPEDFSKAQFRRIHDIPENSTIIIFTAALRPEKNHIGAIKALDILHTKYNLKAYLLVVGSGIMLDKLERLTDETGLNNYVKFVGNQNDVRPYYWISDLFTLCSERETFSISALEAMACGLPCVLTDIGGANEMVYNEINGLLCLPDKNDISQKWYEALGKSFEQYKITQFVHKNFDHTKMVKEYENIFK